MYNYEKIKPFLFTDEGQRKFLAMRDKIHALVKTSGAVRMQEAMSTGSGDTWESMAVVDRMVELGELRQISTPGAPGQYQVYVGGR